MKATLAKDLVIGKIYADNDDFDTNTSFLRHHHFNEEGGLHMEFVGGEDKYFLEGDFIPFPKDSGWFYEVTKKELERHLPTPPKG